MKKKLLVRAFAGLLALEMLVTLPGIDNVTYAKSNGETKAEASKNTEKPKDITQVFRENLVEAQNGQEKDKALKAANAAEDNNDTIKDRKSYVSTAGIAPAFQEKDFYSLYKAGKFKISEGSKLTTTYDKNAKGIIISGTKEQFADTRFTFTDQFDFSQGIIERVQLDAMSYKENTLTMKLYLDDQQESFATIRLLKQKRSKKWYTKIMANNIYSQKITGKHKVSFTIEQSDEAAEVGLLLRNMTFVKSTLPTVYFNIDESLGSIEAMNSDTNHDTECYGSMTIQIPDGYKCEYPDKNGKYDNLKTETYALEYIRGRGNSTWWTEKKPYKIKLDKKADLFNMGKNKHWVLLADYYDPCHIRNKGTYKIGQQMGMEYTPDSVYVDVVMNGQYYGSYLLAEQIRLDSNRVDLDNLEDISDFRTIDPADKSTITGGYLLSMLPYHETTDKIINTAKDESFLIESPSFEEYSSDEAYQAAYNYISNYMQKTENAVYGKDFKNEDGCHYSEYMDVDAAVDYWWIQDFSKNGDGFGSNSTYLYKKRDGKLYWGPLWDFDYVAWGNNEYEGEEDGGYVNYEGWTHTYASWYKKLFTDPAFCAKAINRWKTIKPILVNLAKDNGAIDQYANQIRYSMYYNNMVYGNNYMDEYDKYTFKNSVDQLKSWINNRINWVDEMVGDLAPKKYTIKFMNDNKVISSKEYYQGEKIEAPAEPTKKGYVFVGWYVEEEGEKFDINPETIEVYGDMILKAKWIKESEYVDAKQLLLGYDSVTVGYNKYHDENQVYIPYTFLGGYGKNKKIKWTSSDNKMLESLGNGSFWLHGEGTYEVKAEYTNGKTKLTAKCKVIAVDFMKIDEELVPDAELTVGKKTLKIGDTTIISAKSIPEEAPMFDPYFLTESDCISIEQIGNKCVVKAKKAGKAKISCQVSGSEIAPVTVELVVTNKYGDPIDIKPGSKIIRDKVKYEVVSLVKGGGTLKVLGVADKKIKSAKLPDTITLNKKKFKVVSIGSKAFAGCSKLTSVQLGRNISAIGASAFSGDKKLSKITILSTKLTIKKVGKHAFKGISKKYKLTCPKKYKKAYNSIIGKRMK
ncbi:MAG: CotH kinase family protein [Agathobacter sp.]|nr:CotH kinase family protein [Agathobacter sp.]